MLVLIHISVIIVTGLLVLYSDEQALLWVLGKIPVLDQKRVTVLHRSVSIGLALLLITGGLLYIRDVPFYISDPVFIVKMVAISALILNTYVIERLSHIATTRSYSSLTEKERLPLFISGAVSVAGWGIALICGILISHY
jgi:hypothetical protein